MQTLARIFGVLKFITDRLSLCANTGFMAGALGGVFLDLENSVSGGIQLGSLQEVLIASLMLTGIAWLFVLFVLLVIGRLTFSSIAIPSLVNCFLTCVITTWICNKLSIFPWAWVVGAIVGILVGTSLCRLNQLFSSVKK